MALSFPVLRQPLPLGLQAVGASRSLIPAYPGVDPSSTQFDERGIKVPLSSRQQQN
jgi:hypothetical protein